MRPARLFVASFALVLVATLVLSALALAAPAPELRFQLPGSNGYEVHVSAHQATALIRVSRADDSKRRRASTIYLARRKPSANRIDASFGELGRIDASFHPSGRVTRRGRSAPSCQPAEREVRRYGVFRGEIRFRGENGYTAVAAHRVKGEAIVPAGPGCTSPTAPAAEPSGKVTSLIADLHSGIHGTYLAATLDPLRKARFFAYDDYSEGQLGIAHFAFVHAAPAAFQVDSSLSSATVTPPPPFSGSATLGHDAAGNKLWSGSLTVSFPGAPDVPLTGPQFRTRLVRSF